MLVNKVIIHELFKPIGSNGAKLSKSKTLLDNTNEDVIQLIHELNKRYRKRDEKQGVFDKENPTQFHSSFSNFYYNSIADLDSIFSNQEFIDFSHVSAENLKERIEGIGAAKGGYLVYSFYEDYRKYCSIFFVRDTTGMTFKRNKTVESFDIGKVQHIDFEKLAMACRINMEQFTTTDKKYLSFIHSRNDDLSRYFVNWISSSDTVTSEEETKLLLQVLKTIPMPINPDTTSQFSREDCIKNTHKYIIASPTRTVNLFEVSKNIFTDENYLSDYIYENYSEIPTEFKAHFPTLRRFIKVYAKVEDIELNFNPNAYKDGRIKFDKNDDSQLIIKSKDLVDQIKSALTNE
jgi:nucleoid-associated protein